MDARITVPGETGVYTFTLTEDRDLLFDARAAPDGLTWSLIGPDETLVDRRDFSASEISRVDDPVLSLGPGTYKVAVAADPQDAETGAYRFRLIDIADAQDITPGEDVIATQSTARMAQVYAFDGVETEQYRITGRDITDGPFEVSLISPSGERIGRLVDSLLRAGGLLPPLPETGRYSLVLEGRDLQSQPGSATLLLERVAGPLADEAPEQFYTAPGLKVDGSLSGDNGRIHVHQFDLDTDTWAVFVEDVAADATVVLRGPNGAIDYTPGGPVFLEAGAWELEFSTATTRNTRYAGVVLTSDSVPGLTLGTSMDLDLLPRLGTNAASFHLDEPSMISVSVSSHDVMIVDPEGRVLWNVGVSSTVDIPALVAGDYLIVSSKPFSFGTDTVTLKVDATPLAADALPAHDLGEVVSGTVSAQARSYFTYTGTGEPVMLDAGAQDFNLSWRRFGGDEVVTSPHTFRYPTVQTSNFRQGYVLPSQAGETYIVELRNTGNQDKQYNIALVSLGDGPTLQAGQETTLTADPGNRAGAVRLDLGEVGTRLRIEAPVNFAAALFDAEGAYLGSASASTGRALSNYSGTLYAVFQSANNAADPVEFTVSLDPASGQIDVPPIHRMITPDTGSDPLLLGEGRTGDPALKFQTGTRLHLDLEDAADLAQSFTLEGWFHIDRLTSDRIPLFEQYGTNSRNLAVELFEDGSLRSIVRAGFGNSLATSDAGLIGQNQWHHVALVADRDAGEFRLYVNGVEAAASSRSGNGLANLRPLEISTTGSNNTNPFWGRVDRYAVRDVALDAAQIADIYASGASPATGSIALAIDFTDPDTPLKPTIGEAARVSLVGVPRGDDVVAGILSAGESIRYEFTLDKTTNLYFDNIVGSQPRIYWPDGGSRLLSDPGHVLALEPGTFEIGFNGRGRHAFRLLDLDAAPQIFPDGKVRPVTIPGSASSKVFALDGLRDTVLSVDALSASGIVRVVLYADDGSLIERASSPLAFNGIQLPYDGRYWLAFEGASSAALNTPQSRVASLHAGVPAPPDPIDLDSAQPYAPDWTVLPDGTSALRLRGAEHVHFPASEISDIGRQVTLSASFAVDGLDRRRLLASLRADDGYEILSIGFNDNNQVFARAAQTHDSATNRTATDSTVRTVGTVINVDAIVDRDAGRLFLYVDGTLAASSVVSDSWFDTRAKLVLGGVPATDNDARFHGVIGALRLRSDAADAESRAAGHAGTWAGGDPALTLALDFSEGAGDLVFNRAAGGGSAEILPLDESVIFGRRVSRDDVVEYRIELDEPGFFLLEMLGNMRHRVEVLGPAGETRSERMMPGFQDSDGLVLGAGVHTLRFTRDGGSPPTGDFAFRLVDLAAQTQEITPGQAVTLNSPASDLGTLFRFETEAGRDYSVFDSEGRSLDARIFSATPDLDTLSGISSGFTPARDGIHFLYVAQSNSRPFIREITLYDRQTRRGKLHLDEEAIGTIPRHTVDHRYSVNLDAPTDFLVDVGKGDWLRWELLDAQDAHVAGANLHNNYGSTPRIMQVDPGEYTFRIFTTNTNVRDADYRVTLRDARAAAQPITFNQEVSTGPIDGAAIYTFETTSRTDISLTRTDGSGGFTETQLVSASGEVASDGGWSSLDASLNSVGRWYLVTTAQSSFIVEQDGRDPTIGATEADFNEPGIGFVLDNRRGNAARLVEADDGNRFLRLSGLTDSNAENVVFFDRVHDGDLDAIEFAFDYRATAPAGQASRGDGFTLGWLPSDTLGDTGAKTFYSNNWNNRSDYNDALYLEFQISRSASGDETNRIVLRRGNNTLASVDVAESLAAEDFARMRVELTHVLAGLEVSVHLTRDGADELLLLDRAFVGDRFRLGEGRFAIEVNTPSGNAADHDFDNISIMPTSRGSNDIVFGQVYNGTLEDIGAHNNYPAHRYDFALDAPALILFDGLNGGNSILMEVTGPGLNEGTGRFSRADPSFGGFWNALALGAGEYTVYVSGQSGATGSYGFRMLDLGDATALDDDADTSVSIDPGNTTEAFFFDGVKGEKIFIETLGLDIGEVRLRLLGPDGAEVRTEFVRDTNLRSLWPTELEQDGRYTLLVAGAYGQPDPKTLDLRLHRVERITAPLVFGESTFADIDIPGRERVFTFSLDAPDVVAIAAGLRNNSVFWELRSAEGQIVAERRFSDTRSLFNAPAPHYSLDSGDYELVVTGLERGATYENSIRVLAGADAMPLAPGAPMIIPDIADFGVTAFDLVRIEIGGDTPVELISDTMDGLTLHLLDAQGYPVGQRTSSLSDIPIDLSGLPEGRYFLLAERQRSTGAAPATLELHPVRAPHTISFGDLLEVDTGVTGRQAFTFTLDQRDFVQMDLLGADADTSWRLTGTGGLLLEEELSGFGTLDERVLWKLSEGTYVLEIEQQTGAVLRLQRADTRTELGFGVPSDLRFDPANGSVLQTLEGTAGQEVLLMRAAGSTAGTLRVFSPDGRELGHGSLGSPLRVTLPADGRYLVQATGSGSVSGPAQTARLVAITGLRPAAVPMPRPDVAEGPNLAVDNLRLDGDAVSNQPLTIRWRTENVGQHDATGALQERLVVRNLDTGALLDARLLGLDLDSAALAPGAGMERSATVFLPAGDDGTGEIAIQVITDAVNALDETAPNGLAEFDNAAALTVTASAALFPNLVLENIILPDPADWTPGENVTLRRDLANRGNAPAEGAWTEQALMLQGRNYHTANVLEVRDVVVSDTLGVDETVTRSATFTLPDEEDLVDVFHFEVRLDSGGDVVESVPGVDAEADNIDTARIIAAPHLALSDLRVLTDAPRAGEPLEIGFTITNDGWLDAPGDHRHRIQLYNEDIGERQLEITLPGESIAAGQSVAVTASIDLPFVAVGALELTLHLNRDEDGDRFFTELNPSSGFSSYFPNRDRVYFDAVAPQRADLAAGPVTAPADAQVGEPLSVAWTVENIGPVTTRENVWTDRVILTRNDSPGDAGDVILGEVARDAALAAGDSYAASLDIILPQLDPSEWKVFVITDAGEVLDEPGTRDNNTSVPSLMDITVPDRNLGVTSLSVSAERVFSGSVVDIDWTVENLGTKPIPAGVVDRVYLSASGDIDAEAILLAEVTLAEALAPGESRSLTRTIDLPAGAAGAVQIIVQTNATRVVAESDMTNNTATALIEVQSRPAPDLIVMAVNAPDAANAGGVFDVAFTVSNVGAEAARGPWRDQISLVDADSDDHRRLLVEIERDSDLLPGESYTVSRPVALPGGLSGGFRVAVMTDSTGRVFEAGLDDNNTTISDTPTLIGRPNLVADALQAPATGVAGQAVDLSYEVSNVTDFPVVGDRVDTLWLTRDGTVDDDAVRLGDFVRDAGHGAHETASYAETVTLPLGLTGAFVLVVELNSTGTVIESGSSADNFATASTDIADTVYPDLEITALEVPSELRGTFFQGEFAWSVRNDGETDTRASRWVDELWLIDGDGEEAVLLGRFERFGALATGDSYSRSETISFDVPDGVYTLELRVDADDDVFEAPQGDGPNVARVPIVLARGPHVDLAARDVTLASTAAQAGETLRIEWVVENVGPISTAEAYQTHGSIADRIRLVALDGSSSRLFVRLRPGALDAGDSAQRSVVIGLPRNLAGEYRIEIETNVPQGQLWNHHPIYELFRDNNIAVAAQTVQIAAADLPDLTVTDLVAPDLIDEGEVLDIAWTLRNIGAAATSYGFTETVRFVPPDDSPFRSTVLSRTNTSEFDTIAPDEARERSLRVDTAEIDGFHLGGRIEVRISGGLDFFEVPGGRDNNTIDATIAVNASARPDLELVAIEAPDGVQAGDTVALTYTVENIGPVPADGRWVDRILLASDPDAELHVGRYVSVQNESALAPGERYTSATIELEVPETAVGTMWLIVETNWGRNDTSRDLDELDATLNNRLVVPIEVEALPLPDLVVSDVSSSDQALAGATIEVSYTVTNLGEAATRNDSLIEQIWLTQDRARPSPRGDLLLATRTRDTGELGPLAGYDVVERVTIPEYLETGRWYITPWVDPVNAETERTFSQHVNEDDPTTPDSNNFKAGGGQDGNIIIIGQPEPVLRKDIAVTRLEVVEVPGTDGLYYDFTLGFENRGEQTFDRNRWGWDLRISDGAAGLSNAFPLDHSQYFQIPGDQPRRSMTAPELRPGESYEETRRLPVGPQVKGNFVTLSVWGAGDADPDNNVTYLEMEFEDQVTDLVVTDVTVPDAALQVGGTYEISYTVTNISDNALWPGTERLYDQIWLSAGPGDDPLKLLTSERVVLPEGLDAGASYTRTVEIEIDDSILAGDYRIHVRANNPPESFRGLTPAFNNRFSHEITGGFQTEGRGQQFWDRAYDDLANGNILGTPVQIVAEFPDLVITRFDAPETIIAGELFEAEIEVTNQGPVGTQASRLPDDPAFWADRLFLSKSDEITPESLFVMEEGSASEGALRVDRHGDLAPGESYTALLRGRVHHSVEGEFNLIAMTDASAFSGMQPRPGVRDGFVSSGSAVHDVREGPGEGNNTAARAVTVQPAARPELIIADIDLPDRIVAGEEVTLNWTVANEGADFPTPQNSFALELAFAEPGTGGGIDAQLPRKTVRLDPIAGGESRSGAFSFRVPVTVVEGVYTLRLVVDPPMRGEFGEILETLRGEANDTVTVPVVIDLPPPADLVVRDVLAPGSVQPGQDVTISWKVRNDGDVAVSGPWSDAIYLSRDASLDADDVLMGRLDYDTTLAPGEVATLSHTLRVPPVAEGPWRVLVRTDIFNEVYEAEMTVNNVTSADTITSVSIPQLSLGEMRELSMAAGEARLFRVDPPMAQTMLVRAKGNDGGAPAVFVAQGRVATPSDFDAAQPGGGGPVSRVVQPDTVTGGYYILVRAGDTPVNTTLSASLMPLAISDVSTDRLGIGKFVTTTITGSQFDTGAVPRLSRPGATAFEPVAWSVIDSTTIVATFNLEGAPLGLYDVSVTNSSGARATVPYRVLVEPASEAEVGVALNGPRVVTTTDVIADFPAMVRNFANIDSPYVYFQTYQADFGVNEIIASRTEDGELLRGWPAVATGPRKRPDHGQLWRPAWPCAGTEPGWKGALCCRN